MKKNTNLFFVSILLLIIIFIPKSTEAKGVSYYKSAKTGKFVTKSYSLSHKATTYKSFQK